MAKSAFKRNLPVPELPSLLNCVHCRWLGVTAGFPLFCSLAKVWTRSKFLLPLPSMKVYIPLLSLFLSAPAPQLPWKPELVWVALPRLWTPNNATKSYSVILFFRAINVVPRTFSQLPKPEGKGPSMLSALAAKVLFGLPYWKTVNPWGKDGADPELPTPSKMAWPKATVPQRMTKSALERVLLKSGVFLYARSISRT